MSKKKPYFAQNNKLDPYDHGAKYFWTLEEAEAWLRSENGGTVKKRNAEVVYVFGEPIRVWGEVLKV
ncbi:hypothetical protein [Hydrocoleum sp. CS-953]|uniref:hypothetical protein n=1 Tax=Microcoleaceae TaxID=1892252 RepID=UPI000B9B445B|nr:hypothetical protein [Hydrocoleum sp. CS-953]OZH55812.1 hypothetical protein AFK68_02175 [Hydrocoleum sp. CS-953]